MIPQPRALRNGRRSSNQKHSTTISRYCFIFLQRVVSEKWIVAVILGAAFVSNCSYFQKNPSKQLIGMWTRKEDKGKLVSIEFLPEERHKIYMKTVRMSFDGTFEITDNEIAFVDKYCGTKFRGRYEFDELSKDSFTLKLIEDEYCGRKDFFPGTWYRDRSGEKPNTSNNEKPVSTIGK